MDCFIYEHSARQAAGARQLAQHVQGRQSELLSCARRVHVVWAVAGTVESMLQCVGVFVPVAEDGQARQEALLASAKRGEVRLLWLLSG
jgi:hypothetical protein